ncbi:maleylpyruvate isomerase N-terminal domain-containing protein [Glycomyces arizonensis]|uniref:maleylpyruvate isomerase N-terminal domain-containing protein n=1 Tax=Glycomyces arizonensis TaxID=256035 RepID=UPI000414C126|nr:maleylpyruvate isomerase N-terminal domain-containing protein [Glycomyces arizonensis]
MTPIRKQYLTAAQSALDLLRGPAVAAAWEAASALEGFTVGGLAAHLASQITSGAAALEADFGGKDVIGVLDHYERARASWLEADVGNDYNTAIKDRGNAEAGAGPGEVAAAAEAALKTLHERLPGLGDGALGGVGRWAYATSLDDFLVTRIMELVVHADDLAVSVGVATPEFDADAFDTAAWVLTRLAARRHGQAALVRALARAERAPDSITAL